MAKISYKDYRDRLRREVWPASPGEPRNLVHVHNVFFQEAMAMVATWVKCLQVNHTTVYPFCSTYVDCAKSVIDAPVGLIKKVYTIANNEWCDPVRYWNWTMKEIDCWANDLVLNFVSPSNTNLPALRKGIKFAEETSDITPYGRARIGAWTQYNHRLYLAPWIQSNESIVVEWDGTKQNWADTDMVDDELWDLHVSEFIKLYVRFKDEEQFGVDRNKKVDLKTLYQEKLGDVIYLCDKRTDVVHDEECENPERLTTSEELEDDEPLTEDDTIVFANIGDFCDPDNQSVTDTIAAMIESWTPDFIVTNGDNLYRAGTTYALVEASYGDYITADLTTNKFWPAIGNHDHTDPSGGIDEFYAAFVLPNNERYYDFVKGPVHFFVLHTAVEGNSQETPYEEDGIKVSEKQAEWLRVRLALSTAQWKVVITHEAPYTSGNSNYPGKTYLRWPFSSWGADVVIAGDSHHYERLEVDGFPYIVNGLGGSPIAPLHDPPLAESQITYLDDWGALKCTATCDELKFEFYSQTGVLVDTFTLS